MNKLGLSLVTMSLVMTTGCSHKIATPVAGGTMSADPLSGEQVAIQRRPTSPVVAALPNHIIYRMRDDYANLVPVTLDQNGNIASYPDPVDITETCKPVALGDGWYLDRRGVGRNTAFTNYTYEQYHALDKVPSIDELKAHIIARNVIVELWLCGTADRTIDEYKQLVKDGFPGCKKEVYVISSPAF